MKYRSGSGLRLRISLVCIVLIAGWLSGVQGAEEPGLRVLILGFGPFGGRKENGSWIAAQGARVERQGVSVTAAQIETVWGEPARRLEELVLKVKPTHIICLGEGYPGFFTLEAVARNERRPFKDVRDQLPPASVIDPAGAEEILSTLPLLQLGKTMTESGYLTHISFDAGGYLCNEMLYTVEKLRLSGKGVNTVLFAHVPPLGAVAFTPGGAVQADAALLQGFALALLKAVLPPESEKSPAK